MQLVFSDYELVTAKTQTRWATFLFQIEAVLPWPSLIVLTLPHYPKASKQQA